MNTVQSLLILLATLMMGNSSSSTVYESSEVAASVSASASASASALAQEESNDIKSQLSYIEEQSKRLLGETSTPAPNRPRNPPPSDTSSSGGGSSGGGSSSSSGGSGGGSGSGGGGSGGANGVQSGDLVSVKSSKNLALMLSIAAVAGVAIAAYAVPRRTVTTKSDHPLRGSLNRRINLFSNLAQHADSATRPPRRDEEGHYINADAIV
mmetsp:Transcript_17375/g.19899  ORF Transcript_17375/g.19899 Transcript_17375/m.19899 type:complete len:210 (-) Transcript_17375:390-1019(-)